MKSLERIIREIHEGRSEKGEQKSLAHTIRRVHEGKRDDIDATVGKYGGFDKLNTESEFSYMGSGTGGEPKMHAEDGKKKKTDEAVGSIGTDDYRGNQPFKTTPHIKPPAGSGSHSQAPENAARQRTLAKERTSMSMHGKVNEVNLKFAEPLVKGAEPGIEAIEDLFRVKPKTGGEVTIYGKKAPPVEAPPKPQLPAEVKPKAEVPTQAPPQLEPPKVDTKVEPKLEPPKVDVKTQPKVEIPSEVKTQTKPKMEIPPEVKTKTEPKLEPPKVETKTDTKLKVPPEVKTKTQPKEAKPVEPKTKTKPAEPKEPAEPKKPKPRPFLWPSFGSGKLPDTWYDVLHRVPVKTLVHTAKPHKRHVAEETERKQIENMPRQGERKSIAYVGRKDDDPKTTKEKTSRQASYKINVIDENRRLAGIVLDTVKNKKEQMKVKTEDGIGQSSKTIQYPNGTQVIINPEMTRSTMDIDGKMPNDYK